MNINDRLRKIGVLSEENDIRHDVCRRFCISSANTVVVVFCEHFSDLVNLTEKFQMNGFNLSGGINKEDELSWYATFIASEEEK